MFALLPFLLLLSVMLCINALCTFSLFITLLAIHDSIYIILILPSLTRHISALIPVFIVIKCPV